MDELCVLGNISLKHFCRSILSICFYFVTGIAWDYIYNNLVSRLNNPRNEDYYSENCNGSMLLFLHLFKITWSNIIYSFSGIVG